MQDTPNEPDITDGEAAALARATVNLFRAWQLDDAEARTLLGGMPQRTWTSWKAGSIGSITPDIRARMAVLIGIHMGLRHLLADAARGYAWIRKANAGFGGRSALDVMMRGEIADLIKLRDYLGAKAG